MIGYITSRVNKVFNDDDDDDDDDDDTKPISKVRETLYGLQCYNFERPTICDE